MPLPERHRPAHPTPVSDLGRPVIVFVTVCTDKRKPILAREDVAQLLVSCWHQADHWLVGGYVLMPDHLHLFCAPARTDALPLRNWCRFWKSAASRAWPRLGEQPVWQSDVWDRQLRDDDSYADKWEYVRNNPVRHGLVCRVEEWPYQGEVNPLRWR